MTASISLPFLHIRVPAIEVRQGPGRFLYSFAIDGKVLPSIAAVSRVKRNASMEIEGYQRPEVLSHIQEIRNYLESEAPMVPNAIVVAFNGTVRFEPLGEAQPGTDYVRPGVLIIPQAVGDRRDDLPGWIVDGQQRAAAIRTANVESFPICVTAFITDNVEEQRSQFLLVNSTKPLPKGLIYELLPGTEGQLPSALERRRLPTQLLQRLNRDEDSPFRGMIQTPTTPRGVIKDNSILRMLENSTTDGALFPHRNRITGRGDVEAMLVVVKAFWSAVRNVFRPAWGLTPRNSRLMHGAGITGLGYVMDVAVHRHPKDCSQPEHFLADLDAIAPVCRWTAGSWEFGGGVTRNWNEIQNTGRDIQILATFLLQEHRRRFDADGAGEAETAE